MFIVFGFVGSTWEGQLQKNSYKFYRKKMQTWSTLTFQLLPFWSSYHLCESETFNAYNSNKAFLIWKV
jgi:hypothetical protein